MRLKKSAFALLLGGSLSVLNVGCAAMNAMVSSPAGHSAGSSSPQRVVAIGRVFENQGRYAQARAMYRQALRSDPHNTTAQDRLQYLASMQSPNHRQSVTDEAFAVADVVAPRVSRSRSSQTEQSAPSSTAEPSIRMVRAFESPGEVRSAALTVGGELESALTTTASTVTDAVETKVVEWQPGTPVTGIELSSQPEAVGRVSFSSDATEMYAHSTDYVAEEIGVVSRQAASQRFEVQATEQLIDVTDEVLECTELELFPEAEVSGNVGLWRPARGSISLADVLQWSDAPSGHSSQLIDATRSGSDSGVKALAVALLGEVDQPDQDVVTALKQSAMSQIPMVQAAALDALVLQGHSDSETVDGLLSLLTGDDASIQTRAAGTLIRMANTEWRDDAIAGLYQLLEDGNDNVVAVAATSLSEFGEAAVGCRERLTAVAANTSSELVLEATSMALSRIPRTER